MTTTPKPRGWLWHSLWLLPLLFVEALFVFALLAEGAYNDYTKTYSFPEAVVMVSKVPLAYGVSKPAIMFVPLTLAASAAAQWLLHKQLSRRQVLGLALGRMAAGLVVYFPMSLFAPLYGPVVVAEMLVGTSGETYAESMPIVGAVGLWFWYQVALLIRDWCNRREKTNGCPACSYDRQGLTMSAKCPECGSVP